MVNQFGRRACETILEGDNQLVGQSAITMRFRIKNPALPEEEIFSLFLDPLTPETLRHSDRYGKTLLHHAVKTLSTEGLRKLLAKFSADLINQRDNYGKTPLIEASIYGRSTDVALLLEHGADPHVVSQEQHTAFQEWVLRYGKVAAIDLFKGVMSDELCEQQAASIVNPICSYFLAKPSSSFLPGSSIFANSRGAANAVGAAAAGSSPKRMRSEVEHEVLSQSGSDQEITEDENEILSQTDLDQETSGIQFLVSP